ncbi:PCOC1 endopeptidase, partial [Alopecoenas beccarii]|nr:PCOC1 endopeptidase [Alopecoenas beccarii]
PRGGAQETPVAPPVAPPGPAPPVVTPCPRRCRRGGTLQSSFCRSHFVVTGMIQSLSRGGGAQDAPQRPGWAVVSILDLYKWGGDGTLGGAPPPTVGSPLRLVLPCGLCPVLKKGSSYVLMGQIGDGGPLLPPDAFVAPLRPQQQQLLGTLSKRPCRGGP